MDLTSQTGNGIFDVTFKQFDFTVFSSQKIGKVFGIWESDFLDGDESLIAWKSVLMNSTKPTGTDIYLFLSNNETSAETPTWSGPYRNNETIITEFTKRYMKIRTVMQFSGEYTPGYQYVDNGPLINSISLQCMTSQNSAKFFTKSFDLGFSPRHILVTSESDVPSGANIRYGVTNIDSTKEEMYQFFEQNTVTELTQLPVTGQKIKILIEMSGSYGDPVIVHEFAVMFSDQNEKQVLVNQQ